MNLRPAIVLSLVLISSALWAKESKEAKPLQLMHKFLNSLTTLRPYIFSEEKFKDPKNQALIEKELVNMARASKDIAHEPSLGTATYKPSADVITGHLKETERVFRSGRKSYARWMLNSTLTMCVSCHAQLSTESRNLLPVNVTENFTSDFEQAEFLFTVRNFDKAHELYKNAILKYPKNHLENLQLENALEREVAYFARIKRDAQGGVKALSEYKKLDAMPAYLQNNLTQWIAQFKSWKKEELYDLKNPSTDQIKLFIKRHLEAQKGADAENPNVVNYLYASGILYEYLAKNPKSQITPEVLYWLAVSDRAVNNNFFYSLADIYLKDCITKFPKTAGAKKCFKEFEEQTVVSYSGSAGTNVPESVSSELERLKNLAGVSEE